MTENIDRSNIYNDGLLKMVEAREKKVVENNKIMTDTEATVIKTLRLAKANLTGIKFGELKFKDGPHLLDHYTKYPDFEYPSKDKLDFENHIIGFVHNTSSGDYNGVNIIMSNGERSQLPQLRNGANNWSDVKINPVGAEVKRIVMWGDSDFCGV